jgi:hypothetical protein
MSSGKEGGPYQNPLFRLRNLQGLARVVLVTSRCTAIAPFIAPGFPPAKLSGVFVSDGNELLLIETDTGTVVAAYRNVAFCLRMGLGPHSDNPGGLNGSMQHFLKVFL